MAFDFSGIWIPLITPLQHGAVDTLALQQLVAGYRTSGIRGFASLSTTGEASLLSVQAQDTVLQATIEAARGLPVIAGLVAGTFAEAQQRVQQLNRFDIQAIMLSSPAYIRPSQQGLIQYFTELADSSAVPLVIYEIPYRTGVALELDSLLQLARHPNIQAIKDCAGSVAITRQLIADGNLQVLAGEDFNIFNTLCMGGSGAIAAATHIRPELYVQMMQHIQRGQLAPARQIFHALAPIIEQLFAEPNPGPLKAVLAEMGDIQNELHFPMLPASAALTAQLQQLLQALDAQFSPAEARVC